MKRMLFAAVAALLVAGCSKDDNGLIQKGNSPVFTAVFADENNSTDTKVYADKNLELHWDANDEITVFNGSSVNKQYVFTGAQGAKIGDFEYVKDTETETETTTLVRNFAFYPYNSNVEYATNYDFGRGYNGFYVTIPSTQKYAENSFHKESNVMGAMTTRTDDFNLQFKNICGYFVLRLYGEDAIIKSIKITQVNQRDNPICGKLAVAFHLQTGALKTEVAGGGVLSLDCGDGVKLGKTEESAVDFWFVVSPITQASNGISVTIESTDGKTATLSTSNSIQFSRNNVVKMAPREVVFE